MANTIMDSIMAMVTPEMRQALAARVGEPAESVQDALAAACDAIVSGLARREGDSDFRAQLVDFAGAAAAQSVGSNLGSIAATGPAGATAELVSRFLSMVFGSQQSQVADAIARRHALSAASGVGVLRTAVPMVLAVLGTAQSAGSLARPDAVRGTVPRSAAHEVEGAVPPRWLVPSAITGAVLLGWLALRAFTAPEEARAVATVTAEATNAAATAAGNVPSEAVAAAWAALGDMMKVRLPDGIVLNVPALGVEARLLRFLSGQSAPARDSSWFDFDRLLFNTGKATLQSVSQEQLSNIAAILNAYPQVSIRIGGYTDNTGDPAANLHLSEERANNVMDELVKLGVDPARMSARGYGQRSPTADNSSEEGRQKNRRISLRVAGRPTSV